MSEQYVDVCFQLTHLRPLMSVNRPIVENGLNLYHHSFDHTCGITSKVRVAQMLNELDG